MCPSFFTKCLRTIGPTLFTASLHHIISCSELSVMIVSFSFFHLFKVSVWCKQGIFGRKVLLGEVHIALGSLNLSIKQVAWYKLFIDCHLSDGD